MSSGSLLVDASIPAGYRRALGSDPRLSQSRGTSFTSRGLHHACIVSRLRRSSLADGSSCPWARRALAQRRPADPRPRTDDPRPRRTSERQSLERFLGVLEKNPRRGTALDRVYGYHVERGTLDAFVKTLPRPASPRTRRTAPAWLILGLLEAQRGRDAAAVDGAPPGRGGPARRPAARLLPGPGAGPRRPARRRRRGLRARASPASPPRTDLLEIFQALGRVHQRAQQQRPGAGRLGPARDSSSPTTSGSRSRSPRPWPRRASSSRPCRGSRPWPGRRRDPYRQVQFRIEAAELKVRLGRPPRRSRDFEALLARAQPRELALPRGPPQDRGRLPPQRRPGRPGRLLRALDQEEPRRRRGDGPARPDPGRPGPGGRGPELARQGGQARPVAPRAAAGADRAARRRSRSSPRPPRSTRRWPRPSPNNPDLAPRLGPAAPPRHGPARGRAQGRPPRPSGGGSLDAGRRTPSPPPRSPTCSARPRWPTRRSPSTSKADRAGPDAPQYREYLGEYLPHPEAARRGPGHLAADRRRARTATPRTWAGSPRSSPASATARRPSRRWPRPAGSSPTTSTSGSSWPTCCSQLERFDDALAELDAAEQAGRRRRADARRSSSAQIKTYQAAGTLAGADRGAAKELDGRHGTPTAAALDPAGPLPRGRRQARPRRRRRSSEAIAARPESVPAWAVAGADPRGGRRPRRRGRRLPHARRARPPRRTEYLTGVAKLEARLGRRDAGAQGRPRPARRGAGQPRALPVLRRPLLPARRDRGGARRPPPGRPGQPDRPEGDPHPGRDPGRPVPHRGGDRALLAGLRPDARTSTASSASSPG